MRINYNVSAMLTNNNLANNDNLLAKSLQRLSSGLKINAAKDNPAGLAMAKRMNSQLESLAVATQSAGDGVSVIETADGALAEISDMLQRMNELAIKAANGIESENDRQIIQAEVKQLTQEIERVAETTEFNGQKLLNGEFSLKGYVSGTPTNGVKLSSYSKDVTAKIYAISGMVVKENPTPRYTITVDQDELEKNGFPPGCTASINNNLVTIKDAAGAEVRTMSLVEAEKLSGLTIKENLVPRYMVTVDPADLEKGGFPKGCTASMKDNLVTIKGTNGFEMTLDLTDAMKKQGFPDPNDTLTLPDFNVDIKGFGSMVLQVGANEGQVLEVEIPKISLSEMGLNNYFVKDENGKEIWTLNVTTQDSAREGIDRISGAVGFISRIRGQLGAYQNRLESTINSLNVTTENMTAAYSRIMDVDMAEEMTNYTTYQVMTQAATSMLAQANERPSQVLQLLQ